MNCEDFKSQMVDLMDINATIDQYPELQQHLAQCKECREYYQEMVGVAHWLTSGKSSCTSTPEKTTPPSSKHRRRLITLNWQSIAASVAIFIGGLTFGLFNFFSQPATAEPFSLEQAINHVENVGNYQMLLQVRSHANENFEYIDPKADFIPMYMTYLNQNDTAFWRLEKVGGRTTVWDGKRQYLWIPDIAHYQSQHQYAFVGHLSALLNPYRLLNAQQLAVRMGKSTHSETKIVDSTAIITITFDHTFTDLDALFKDQSNSPQHIIIENRCSLKDGLLRNIAIWTEKDHHKIELLRCDTILYNTAVYREVLTRIPQNATWIDADNHPTTKMEAKRLRLLQKESATDAAKRILDAVCTGQTEKAKEALRYFPIAPLTAHYKGCQYKNFSAPKQDKNYTGCFVFFQIIYPDGHTERKHVALRNDNPERIWILDGGL